jgi:hypothetical protein
MEQNKISNILVTGTCGKTQNLNNYIVSNKQANNNNKINNLRSTKKSQQHLHKRFFYRQPE